MSVNISLEANPRSLAKRFLTLDIARGMAIIGMLILHIISDTLNVDVLLSDINSLSLINLLALVILPFLGGLTGFFLIISAIGNMVSFYRGLNRGDPVGSIVFKQVFGGILLLIFAMLSEGLIGYHGTFGEIFLHLNNVNNPTLLHYLWRWNYFETVHTIAWCIIINGLVQGLLSIKENWKKTTRLIIIYIVLAVLVIGLTQPIWTLINNYITGYPWTKYPNGHDMTYPWIGSENFWHILRAPFLTALASPIEPIFPYLAVSFIGSIIGIVLSQPKEKISKKFPRNVFLVGLVMFLAGLIGIVFILLRIMSGTYGVDGFDVAIKFYQYISTHRQWVPDAANTIFPGETVIIPPFSWLAQFCVLNGFSIMIIMFLFRFVEFRGKGNVYAPRTKIIRRFGVVAFSNYNNQFIYFFIFYLVSLMIYRIPYQRLFWGGTFLVLILTLVIFSFLLWGWEKIHYIGSLEWFIRTISANLVPARRKLVSDTKWWKKGNIVAERSFYNVDWIDFSTNDDSPKEDKTIVQETQKDESRLGLILSIIGIASLLFNYMSFLGLFVSARERKNGGKNKINTASFVLSIIGSVLFLAFIITSFFLPIGVLGIF